MRFSRILGHPLRELLQVLKPDGALLPKRMFGLTPDQVLATYKMMVLARRFGREIDRPPTAGPDGNVCFQFRTGGDADRDASWRFKEQRLDLSDVPRISAWCSRKGVPLDSLLNKLFGNAEDESLGRDLPNTFGWKKYRLFSLAAPIASHLQPCVGFAMAAKSRGEGL